MTGPLWSPELHHLAGHTGPAEGCPDCAAARTDCAGRVRFARASKADSWVERLRERAAKAVPEYTVLDCTWCGYWHAVPVPAPPAVRRILRYLGSGGR